MHSHMHTQTHINTERERERERERLTQTHACTRTPVNTHTFTYADILAHTHKHPPTHSHSPSHPHPHTHTHSTANGAPPDEWVPQPQQQPLTGQSSTKHRAHEQRHMSPEMQISWFIHATGRRCRWRTVFLFCFFPFLFPLSFLSIEQGC